MAKIDTDTLKRVNYRSLKKLRKSIKYILFQEDNFNPKNVERRGK